MARLERGPRGLVQALVRANFGVAFMPRSIARSAGLAWVHMNDVSIARQVKLPAQAERPTSAAQQAVIASLLAPERA